MSKITLSSLSNLQNETTAVGVINSNSTVLQTAFDNTLSRDGTTPNTMGANLDMNSNQILNLPAPVSGSSPARLQDVVSNPNLVLTIPAIGTSGATVGLLNTNNTTSGNNTHTGTETFSNTISGTNATLSGTLGVTGTTTLTVNPVLSTGALQFSGTTVGVNTGAGSKQLKVRSGTTANSANSVQHQGYQASFEVINNAANQNWYFAVDDNDSDKLKIGPGYSPGQGLSPSIVIAKTSPFNPQLVGTGTNDNATAGYVGEYISSTVTSGSAVNITPTLTPFNVTSISLTAGDWDVWGTIFYNTTNTTNVTRLFGTIGSVSATINTTPGQYAEFSTAANVLNPSGAAIPTLVINTNRWSLSSTTTIYLVASAAFSVSTVSAYGIIQARRVR